MFVASCRYTLIKKTATAFARRSCGEKLQEGEARENKVVSGKEKKCHKMSHREPFKNVPAAAFRAALL